LWTAAAAVRAKRGGAKVRVPWAVFWGVFPDLLAFGPPLAAGLWLWAVGAAVPAHGRLHRHVDLGIPLYSTGHSLVIFAAVFVLASLAARRPIISMLGWLLHILIDIPTHSHRYYATRFLWPFSNYGFDGMPWWNPWMMAATYAGLVVVYLLLWRKGFLRRAPAPARGAAEGAEAALSPPKLP
jgi:hypothetical protein